MKLSEFNNSFLTKLLEKISFEKNIIVLLGEFNANLIHDDLDRDFFRFFRYKVFKLSSTKNYNTILYNFKISNLVDNIFVNKYDPTFMSGNPTTSFSDHLTQFLIIFSVKKKNELAKVTDQSSTGI